MLFWTAIAFVGADAAEVLPPVPDGEWKTPAKDFQNTRFSGLDQIKTDNAKELRLAWSFSTGVNRGQESAPIVVGDTMFVITPFPNILYALDLRNNGAVKWKYQPHPAAAAQGVACCDVVNRGCAFDNGRDLLQHARRHMFARWTPRPARSCGKPRSAKSIMAKP